MKEVAKMDWMKLGGNVEEKNGVLRGEEGRQTFVFTADNARKTSPFETEIRLKGRRATRGYISVRSQRTAWTGMVGYSFTVNVQVIRSD